MCLPLEEQNLCRRNISDHEQSKAAMPLLSPHEQNFSDDRCQPIPTEIQREQGLESGGQGFTTFVNQIKHSQKVSNASAQGFYLQNHLCGQQDKHLSTPYLTVHHISLKHTVPYGGPRFSIFRKLNNKVRFNCLITNKSYLLFYK